MIVQRRTLFYVYGLLSTFKVQAVIRNSYKHGSSFMHRQQNSSRTQISNDSGVKLVKTAISACFVRIVVARGWAKSYKHA